MDCTPLAKNRARWRVFAQFSENNYLMCRTVDSIVRYAPLCIHSFRLIAPRKLLEAQLFNRRYHSYEEIQNVPDRLRWCRHHLGLMQNEVAALIRISRAQYIDLETGCVDHYPKIIVDRLAELYHVPPDDLLDEYNRFLYQGQGKLLQACRDKLGLQKKPFAHWLGIDPNLLRAWESEKKRVSKQSWEKYFKKLL